MNVEIRILSESDAEEMRRLRLRALTEEAESFGEAPEEFAAKSLADISAKLKSSNSSFVLGAFTPKLVAMLGFYRSQSIKTRHKAFIWGVYVSPESRRFGIARALLFETISRACQLESLEYLTLTVCAMNKAARGLYYSLGFHRYGIERAAMKINGRYIDEELLELNLAAFERH